MELCCSQGKPVRRYQFKGKSVAVLTSGGDAQGMNAAVRAVVRMGIYLGCEVYFIREGYTGLIEGGDESISLANWADVSNIIHIGGTTIGSARSKEFREREGRLKAATNLVNRGITNLVVIGGDGSLTGANLFRTEWPDLLKELVETKKIPQGSAEKYHHFNIVGLIGSIDNDFCGSDVTIGVDSALHRITEATDTITTTANSHQRCFILEVMGRNCGYLALIGGLACEADWIFIPEMQQKEDWKKTLCANLKETRNTGKRVNIIMVAEGATNPDGTRINCNDLQHLIKTEVHIDTRVTVLGHMQRGGRPSAFDRNLGTRMGVEAVLALMDADRDPNLPACVITIEGNKIIRVPLMECVEKTQELAAALKRGEFEHATDLRGPGFAANLELYLKLSKIVNPVKSVIKGMKIGIINVGAPACGVNAAMRSFTRLSISNGYTVYGISRGFEGLVKDDVEEIKWEQTRGWAGEGGSVIGIRRNTPKDYGIDVIAAKLAKHQIKGLFVVGGFEAFDSLLQLEEGRKKYPSLCIPMLLIPATISNNVPGTDFSLGCDTALNEIVIVADKIKLSAQGTQRRVFVLETMGGFCGYLATLSGLAAGADQAYIFEEPFTIDTMREDVRHLKAKMKANVQWGLVLRTEYANKNYSTELIKSLYEEEGKGVFNCKYNILGHMQQGDLPSPFDRKLGTKLGSLASEWMDRQLSDCPREGETLPTDKPESCVLLGIRGNKYQFSPVTEVRKTTDMKHRIPTEQWWMNMRPLMRIMAKHDSTYTVESTFMSPPK